MGLSIHKLPIIEVAGSSLTMGRDYGEACREGIRELSEIRIEAALAHAERRGRRFDKEQAKAIAKECLKEVEEFDGEAYQELLGISQGAVISMEELYILQGLTDFRDFLSWGKLPDGMGCTSMIVGRSRSSTGEVILAQNWDLMTSNMPFVCLVKRRPSNAPATISLTVTGGLSMIGMNSEGVAIGTNNIKTTDSRIGVHYLNLIHKAMRCKSAEQVTQMIRKARRSGAHYFMIADGSGNYAGLECSATRGGVLMPQNDLVTHCNHPLLQEVSVLNAEDMGPSTEHRQKRIDDLLAEGDISQDRIRLVLSDHQGDDLAICRHDVSGGISTNACVIIEPESRTLHACRSMAHEGEWVCCSL